MTPANLARADRPIGQTEGLARPEAEGGAAGFRVGRAIKLLVLALAAMASAARAIAPSDFDWIVPVSEIRQVLLGDTVMVSVAPWPGISRTATLRLARVECIPGMDERAANFTSEALFGSPKILLAPMGRGGATVLCEIFYEKDGSMRSLSEDLLNAGLARAGRRSGGI